MTKNTTTYRFLTVISILIVIVLNGIHLSSKAVNQNTIDLSQKDKKEVVLKQVSYEAVVPFFQLDFQQEFDFVKPFFWQSESENISTIKDNYIHLLLSYFFNLFTSTICINAP